MSLVTKRIMLTGLVVWVLALGLVASLFLRVESRMVEPFPGFAVTCGDARGDRPISIVDREQLLKTCEGLADGATPLIDRSRPPYEKTDWKVPVAEWIAITAAIWGLTVGAALIAVIWRRQP